MKKKLLFIMSAMDSGGGQRSLLTLLTLLDYDRYDVDLFLFNCSGLFFDKLPEQVNLLPHSRDYRDFTLPFSASVKALLRRGRFGLLVNRLRYARALRRFAGHPLQAEANAWRFLKSALPNDLPDYDAAIGYLEGGPIYFAVDCVQAKTKIGYIHNDYTKLGLSADFDRPFVEKLDYFVTVSPECGHVLAQQFPEAANKIRVIENIISPTVLQKQACDTPPEFEALTCPKLLTIGRLSRQKGYDLAAAAAEKMKKDGVDFKWFCIGTGELKNRIEQTVVEKDLSDCFVLLGERANPYPYMAHCDIYAQPSRYEGKSIALDETKCFAKPIVATKFSTVFDQLTDGETALLAEMNGEEIAAKIEALFAEQTLCETLSKNLKNEKVGNEEELEKFIALIE
jgi:glycosyltransferase involved in cell wall biosynthesis